MSEPVQVLVLGAGWKEPWYQLTQEERDEIWAKVEEIEKRAGAKWVAFCHSRWADEAVYDWGVLEYPSIEAHQKKVKEFEELGFWRYWSAKTILGAKSELPW